MGMEKGRGLKGAANPNYRHGHRGSTSTSGAYNSWYGMVQRCTNPKRRYYHRYGGRGITVAPEWLEFSKFLADMGERPPNCSLDRIDNDAGYYPGNCRWATQSTQIRNSANCVQLTYGGMRRPIISWCEDFSISPGVVYRRLKRGWTPEEALTTPLKKVTDPRKARRATCKS
jgi:hypothetical protein